MVVLNALRRTPPALQRNPVLFVPVLVVVLFQLPQLVLQTIHPLLASVVSLVLSLVYIVLTPFFLAGVVGMADEALDGRTSFATFVEVGKANYVSVLVAYLVTVSVNFALGIVAAVVAIFGGFALLGGSHGAIGTGALVALGLVGLVVVIAYLLFVFFVQFYGQAIVVDDLGAIDGLKRSVSVVRHNLLSTLGYTVIVVGVGGAVGVGGGLLSLLSSAESTGIVAVPQPSVAVTVVLAVVVAVVVTLFGGVFAVFSVAFYRAVRGPRSSA